MGEPDEIISLGMITENVVTVLGERLGAKSGGFKCY